MSKEEILKKCITGYRGSIKRSDALQAMDTYAQEIAVGFAEHLINMMKIQCTTEHMTDLYQQFLTNKNEKNEKSISIPCR